MCELAIIDPKEYSNVRIQEIANILYRTMRSSLGILAVKDDGDTFDFATYEQVEPERETLADFISEHASTSTRFVIHGRLATTGAETRENAHPLEIDCPECDIDYVLHNGTIYGHEKSVSLHESRGHEYNTDVDTEVIAHDHETVPTEFNGEPRAVHGREPAYVLANEDAVYIYTNGSYQLSEQGTLAGGGRKFGPSRSEESYSEVILTPPEAE